MPAPLWFETHLHIFPNLSVFRPAPVELIYYFLLLRMPHFKSVQLDFALHVRSRIAVGLERGKADQLL